ncbi:hypothetical protein [Caballeronia sp. GAWG1-1]|uniref:hypothetical protein n=1 Tax=Caballeronia sp. GAWG1-1 TaxID=2921742 RepID=UPI0032EABCE5
MKTVPLSFATRFTAPSAIKLAAALAASLVLAACGGGGGGGDAKEASSTSAAGTNSSGSAATTTTTTTTQSGAASASAATTTTTTASTSDTTSSAHTVSGSNSTSSNDTTVIAPTAPAAPVTPVTPIVPPVANNPPASSGSPASGTIVTPVTPVTVHSIFYGANGHNNEGGAYDISSPALQLSQLQDLGVKMYRNEVFSAFGATKLAGIATTMAAGGVTVYPVMLMDLNYSSEADAYNAAFTLGQQTAAAYRYPYYEVSNELEALCLTGNVDGIYPQHYDNAKFQIARGVIRGMIAGVKSVDTAGKIVMGGGAWMHYGFDQMLANGTQPDGTTNHPIVSWDITAWHWYSDQGDIVNACGGTGCHNVLAALAQFNKPIWINEFGVRPSYGTDTQTANYLVGNLMMAEFVLLARQYNIQSIQTYELYDDPVGGEGPYGLMQNDGRTIKPKYTAFKNFVAANPM